MKLNHSSFDISCSVFAFVTVFLLKMIWMWCIITSANVGYITSNVGIYFRCSQDGRDSGLTFLTDWTNNIPVIPSRPPLQTDGQILFKHGKFFGGN